MIDLPDSSLTALVLRHARRIEAVAEIPRSASGKILRRVLVEREREVAASGRGP
jgi:acyl-coenzyme A synthetase/AMP-(fatty) acid ligase